MGSGFYAVLSIMDKTTYNHIVHSIPKQLVLDTSEVVPQLASTTDTPSWRVCDDLLTLLMVEDQIYPGLVYWAIDEVACSSLLLNSPQGEIFLELDKLSHRFMDKFREYKVYTHGILPYKCDEVLNNGCLLLRRIDTFEEFTELSSFKNGLRQETK